MRRASIEIAAEAVLQSLGLLDQLIARSVDEDYEYAMSVTSRHIRDKDVCAVGWLDRLIAELHEEVGLDA